MVDRVGLYWWKGLGYMVGNVGLHDGVLWVHTEGVALNDLVLGYMVGSVGLHGGMFGYMVECVGLYFGEC